MEDYREINPIYRFSYGGEHFYEIVIDTNRSVYFSLSAKESSKLRSVDMVEFHSLKREAMCWNMQNENSDQIPSGQPSA